MTRISLSIATAALALAVGTPAFAADAMQMTKADTALKAKCTKLGAAAAKNAKCVAFKKAHMDSSMQAGDAMMSNDGAMEAKKH